MLDCLLDIPFVGQLKQYAQKEVGGARAPSRPSHSKKVRISNGDPAVGGHPPHPKIPWVDPWILHLEGCTPTCSAP